MYGQSCRVVGRGGLGLLRFRGASLCWGRSVTLHRQRSVGIPQVRWVHLARQYIALPRPWLPLRMESSVSKDLPSPSKPFLALLRGKLKPASRRYDVFMRRLFSQEAAATK